MPVCDPAAVRQGLAVFAGPRSAIAALSSCETLAAGFALAAKAVCAAARSAAIWRRNRDRAIGDTMAPIKFGVGQSVLRKEDDALIRGKGRYTDDHAPQPALHALVLRSPHAHAKFTINASRARGLPGVGADPDRPRTSRISAICRACSICEVDPFTGPPYPILAQGRGAPCRRRRRLRGRRHHRSGARRDRGDRGQLDAAAGGGRRRQRGQEGRAAGLARPCRQRAVRRADRRQEGDRGRLRQGACGRRNLDRQSARRHQLHGNARGGLRIRRQARSSDADDRQPGQPSPARNPVPEWC